MRFYSSGVVMSLYEVSVYNIDRLTKQARGLWQNLDQLLHVVKSAGKISTIDCYVQENMDNKLEEIQSLIRVASRSMDELTYEIFVLINGEEPLGEGRISQITSLLQTVKRLEDPEGTPNPLLGACHELLQEAKRNQPERYTGDDLIVSRS